METELRPDDQAVKLETELEDNEPADPEVDRDPQFDQEPSEADQDRNGPYFFQG